MPEASESVVTYFPLSDSAKKALKAVGINIKDLLWILSGDKKDLSKAQVDSILAASTALDVELKEKLISTDDYFELLNKQNDSDYPIDSVGTWWGDANFRDIGGTAYNMTPDEYLAAVKPLTLDEETLENVQDLVDHVQAGGKLDPLVIYKSGDEDGRHRALAAKHLGYSHVPVVDYRNSENNLKKSIKNGLKFLNEGIDKAQSDAALSVKDGGLGLGPDNTPDDRAKALGFDTSTVWYHGTGEDFKGFDDEAEPRFDNGQQLLGSFFTTNPSYAARYAEDNLSSVDYDRDGEFNPNIIPAYLRGKFKEEPLSKIAEIEDEMTFEEVDNYKNSVSAEGYDGIIFGNVDANEIHEVAVFDNNNIRSVNAVFNVGDALSPDMLFSKNDGKESFLTQVEAIEEISKDPLLKKALDDGKIIIIDNKKGIPKGADLMMTAWHGSPHDHDGFDDGSIGSGEGADVYGYGHYFAGSRSVAEWYRDNLTETYGRGVREDQVAKIVNNPEAAELGTTAAKVIQLISEKAVLNSSALKALGIEPEELNFEDVDDTINALSLERYEYGARSLTTDQVGKDLASVYCYSDGSAILTVGEGEPVAINAFTDGSLYEVELAPNEDEYLLWEKKLSEQSQVVQDAAKFNSLILSDDYDKYKQALLEKYGDKKGIIINATIDESEKMQKMGKLAREDDQIEDLSGEALYKKLYYDLGSKKEASDRLAAAGIKGIKYLDGNSRNKATFHVTPPTETVSGQWMVKGDDYNSKGTHFDLEKDAKEFLKKTLSTLEYNYVVFSDDDVTITEKHFKESQIEKRKKLLESFGMTVVDDKVVVYRGDSSSMDNARKLSFDDILFAAKTGLDQLGNRGADSAGKHIEKFELPVIDVDLTDSGKLIYKGQKIGFKERKYPDEIYKAFLDYYPAKISYEEIDLMEKGLVRFTASSIMKSGEKEFDSLMKEHEMIAQKKAEQEINERKDTLKNCGVELIGNKAIVYRGADVSADKIKELRYNDYLSAVNEGFDKTGNGGAASYGKNVVRFELPIMDVDVAGTGELLFKGEAPELAQARYPQEICRAFSDAIGCHYSMEEIEANDHKYVRDVASQSLAGGSEEFDLLDGRHQAKFSKNKRVQGASINGKAYIVLDGNKANEVKATAYHELTHVMMDDTNYLSSKAYLTLKKRLRVQLEKSSKDPFWKDVMANVTRAGTKKEHVLDEVAAYAVTEYLNKNKNLPTGIKKWVGDMSASIKGSLFKFVGIQVGEITPQELLAMTQSYVKDLAVNSLSPIDYGYRAESPMWRQQPEEDPGKLAQRNAALPLNEGGLGLPHDNSAEDRAEAMGFDVDNLYYHGSRASFSEFKVGKSTGNQGETDQIIGMYFTDNIDGAGFFSSNVEDPRHMKRVYLSFDNGYEAESKPELMASLGVKDLASVKQALEAKGYDGLIIKKGFYAMGGPHKEVIAFNPKQIRSVDASFDPMMKDKSKILYSKAMGGVKPSHSWEKIISGGLSKEP